MKKETQRVIDFINQTPLDTKLGLDSRLDPVDFLNHISHVQKEKQVYCINDIFSIGKNRVFSSFYYLEAQAIEYIIPIFNDLDKLTQLQFIVKTNAFPNLKLDAQYWTEVEDKKTKNEFTNAEFFGENINRVIKKNPDVLFRCFLLGSLLSISKNIYTSKIADTIYNYSTEKEIKDIEYLMPYFIKLPGIYPKKLDAISKKFQIKDKCYERLIVLQFNTILSRGSNEWLHLVYEYKKNHPTLKNHIFVKSADELEHCILDIYQKMQLFHKSNYAQLKEFLSFTYFKEQTPNEAQQILNFLSYLEQDRKKIDTKHRLGKISSLVLDVKAMAEKEVFESLLQKNDIAKDEQIHNKIRKKI
jgi:hypothetical protein